jgi:hypothetical protein
VLELHAEPECGWQAGVSSDMRPIASCQLTTGQIESEDNFRVADYWKVDRRGTALLPLLNGLNIARDLVQVRKVVTGQQPQHHAQGLWAAFVVLSGALQILW